MGWRSLTEILGASEAGFGAEDDVVAVGTIR